MEHDSHHSTSLRTSALAYLDSASSLRRTATALGVHVNTVTQRLTRIDRVLSADWREAHRRVDIHHALRLASLRGST